MSTTKQEISQTAHARIRKVSTLAMIIVALAAAVLSWHGLTMLGEQAGFAELSILLPLVIDGTMLVGALHVLHASLTGLSTRWGWGMTLVGVAFSTWGNVAGASTSGVASGIVHAIPALALAASVEATMRIIRHGIAVTSTLSIEPLEPVSVPSPPGGGGGVETRSSPTASGTTTTSESRSEVAAPRTQPARRHLTDASGEEQSSPITAPSNVRAHLRAVAVGPASVDGVPPELAQLAAWVRRRKSEGESDSAAQAVKADVASSLSVAKRSLARLRGDFPEVLEPVNEQETGS